MLDRFVEVGLIDDRAYAEAFVAAKHRDRALGVTALRTELRRKGVDEVTVDAAVQQVDQDAERDRARALISRRVDAAMGNGCRPPGGGWSACWPAAVIRPSSRGQVVDEALAEYGAEDQDARLSGDCAAGQVRSAVAAWSSEGGRGRRRDGPVAGLRAEGDRPRGWPRRDCPKAAAAGRLDPWCVAP